jgi:hypothetical protein
MRLSVMAACCGLLAAAPAQAAEILNFPKPKASRVQPAGISASCREWTDDCRICSLSDKGEAACSNVGIACLPKKWRCTGPQ